MVAPERVQDNVEVLLRDTHVSDSLLRTLVNARRLVYATGTVARAHGIQSRVYCLADDWIKDAYHGQLCVKRVVEDDQVVPHSVDREVNCYDILRSKCSDEDPTGHRHIMNTLAAFRDDSDDFNILVDIVMPWYPCTLQDLLNEPSLHVSLCASGAKPEIPNQSVDRASLAVMKQIRDPVRFVLSTARDVFAALTFLHSTCGIAHRDVKPSNIVVRASDVCIKLIDFGTCSLDLDEDGKPHADDTRRSQLASEVGTGAYRPPECFLSPKNGYNAYAVDVWETAVMLTEFFLPPEKVATRRPSRPHFSTSNDRAVTDEQQNGQEQEANADWPQWQKAMWADDDGESWSQLLRDDALDDQYVEREATASGYISTTLFDGSRGDLGLASSIFSLLGLPEADNSDGAGGSNAWPEATYFQPTLAKLPFHRQNPDPHGLRGRLLAHHLSEPETVWDDRLVELVNILEKCVRLSASERISASHAHSTLNTLITT